MYTPELFVSQRREMAEKQDWWLYENLYQKAISPYSEFRKWEEINRFFSKVLSISGIPEKYRGELEAFDFSSYESKMELAFSVASEAATKDSNAKAIYFEYEDGQANFFICHRFEKSNESDWAAYFEEVVPAPELETGIDLFAADVSNYAQQIMMDYLHARISIALGKALKRYSQLPVAMAEHDGEIVYYQP